MFQGIWNFVMLLDLLVVAAFGQAVWLDDQIADRETWEIMEKDYLLKCTEIIGGRRRKWLITLHPVYSLYRQVIKGWN